MNEGNQQSNNDVDNLEYRLLKDVEEKSLILSENIIQLEPAFCDDIYDRVILTLYILL